MPHLADEDVLRVEQIPVPLALDHVDHTGLQVQQQSSWNIVVVVGLVEKNILAIVSLCSDASLTPGSGHA